MQIKYWSNFSKRVNSTKQPTGGTTVDVLLKDECDILNPSFILNTTNFDINYVQAFGNYYFAYPINIDGHRTEIKCALDHLATFKSNIGNYRGLIEYAASSSRTDIIDPRNPPTTQTVNTHEDKDPGWNVSNTGVYVVGVCGEGWGLACGVIRYYVVTGSELDDILNDLFTNNKVQQIVQQFNGALFDSIVSVIWLPFDHDWVVTNFCTTQTSFLIGNIAVGTGGNPVLKRVWNKDLTFAGVASYSDQSEYIYHDPYVTGSLYLPGVGTTALGSDIFSGTNEGSFSVYMYLDILTGDIVYNLQLNAAVPGKMPPIATYGGNVAAKVPISGNSQDSIGFARGIMTVIGGGLKAVAGNPSGLLEAGAGFGKMIESSATHSMVLGSNSSPTALLHWSKLTAHYQKHVPIYQHNDLLTYKTVHGMPYYQMATISSLAGYIKCADASVDMPGDGAEQDTVNNYLNSGFYYE